MGTPLLLSDLAVHREQGGDEARYFAVQGGGAPSRGILGGPGATGRWGDLGATSHALGLEAAARGLAEALHTFPGDAGDAEREAKASEAYERACARQAAYARGFVDVARWAIARTRSS